MAFKKYVICMKYALIGVNLFGILTGVVVLATSLYNIVADGGEEDRRNMTDSELLASSGTIPGISPGSPGAGDRNSETVPVKNKSGSNSSPEGEEDDDIGEHLGDPLGMDEELNNEVLIIFSVITVTVAALGFWGAIRESICLLLVYGLIIFVSFFFRVVVLIQAYSIDKLDYPWISVSCALVELLVTGFSFKLAWEIKAMSRNPGATSSSSSPDPVSADPSKGISLVIVDTGLNNATGATILKDDQVEHHSAPPPPPRAPSSPLSLKVLSSSDPAAPFPENGKSISKENNPAP